MSDLELLLEKVRTAEVGSWELDGQIFNAVVGVDAHDAKRWYGGGIESHVTTSLDAIVALIEREFLVNTTRTTTDPSGCSAQITWWPEGLTGGKRVQSNEINVSLPLALCAAFLSAKIQTGSGETGNE